MNIQPLNDRVILKRETEDEKTKGGLYIPDNAKEKPARGTILAVGPKAEQVKAGDKVLFGKYAGTEVKLEGEDLLIMREEDVIGVIQ